MLTRSKSLLSMLVSIDRESTVESQTLDDGHMNRARLDGASVSLSSSFSRDFSLSQGENTKRSASTSVPLSHAQYRFLVGCHSAQKAVLDKLKAKGVDCGFDLDRRELLAETDSSIDATYVSKELGKIIIEHSLDVSPDHMDFLAAGVDTDVLTSWKSLNVNEAVIMKQGGTLMLVGLADSVDGLRKELKKTLDHLDATAADVKKKKRTGRSCYVDVLPLSENCYEYLCTFKTDVVVAYGSRDVKINFTSADENCPQGIEIAGAARDVQRAKEKLREIVKQVKSTRFMLPGAVLSASDKTKVYGIAYKHNSIVRIGQSLTCDTMSEETIRLKQNRVETSVAVIVNELQQLQMADVIVNTTNKNLTLGVGRVSKTLLKACGSGVQKELREKYPDGIEHGDVAITGHGGLKCIYIYHGALPYWKGLEACSMEQCYIALVLLVYRCLLKASASGCTSIAFPALGTGALEYPHEKVVLLMYATVRLFLEQFPDSSLEKIYFVVYPWANREIQQTFYAGSITQKVHTEQMEANDGQKEVFSSQSVNPEVLFRVGKTLVNIVNADVKEAIHVSSPVLVLWRKEEMQDPKLNKVLSSLYQREEVNRTFSPKVRELLGRTAVLDETSVSTRTFIHCCCPSDKDKDVMTTVQQGLQRANKDKLNTVTLPIPPGGVLADNPASAADIVLKAVKKYSTCVFVVAVVIPDSHMFTEFVTEAAKLYKSEVPPTSGLIDLAENIWTQISQTQVAVRMHPTEENTMLTVTSDSDKMNNRVALEIQKDIQK